MDVCEQLETLSTQQMQQLFSGLRALLGNDYVYFYLNVPTLSISFFLSQPSP